MPGTLVNEFSAVDGCDVFDLQMYRELGLDLTTLEDPSSDAVMPQLRVAATKFVGAQAMADKPIKYKEPVAQELRKAVGQVEREMLEANREFLSRILDAGISTVRIEHEAVQAYVERNPDISKTAIKRMLKQITRLELVLVRPIDPVTDPQWRQDIGMDHFDGPFTWLAKNAASAPFMPEEHAAELTQARIATQTDHRRYNLN